MRLPPKHRGPRNPSVVDTARTRGWGIAVLLRDCRVLLLGMAFALASCAGPRTVELGKPVTESPFALGLISGDHLPADLRSYLKAEGVNDVYRDSPAQAVRVLSERLEKKSSSEARMLLARLCVKTGEKLKEEEPIEAAGYYLEAARLAERGAVAAADAPGDPPFRILYNHSTRIVAIILFDAGKLSDKTIHVEGPTTGYTVRIDSFGAGRVNPGLIDTLVPADYLKFKKIDDLSRIRQEGLGGRLVGHRAGSEERRQREPLLHPDHGMAIPMTAILDFGGSGERGAVRLSLYDTLIEGEGVLRGVKVPLATDLSAPLAILENYREGGDTGLKNMIRPLRDEARTGLFKMEPFRSDEIPVVFVHGLQSSPRVWLEALNQLRADPVLRNRYQLLVYEYPTGFPIALNAATLRKHLAAFRERHDPGGTNEAMRNMVLVGHSMGGILSNYQVRDSGEAFREKIFDRPLAQTGLTEEQKAMLEPVLYFEANPDIRRVIFVASPHGGSSLATGIVGTIGMALIRLPFEVLFGALSFAVDSLTEEGRQMVGQRINSVYGLQPESPGLTAVWQMPVRGGVPLHSIVAQKNPGTPLEKSTDGVVPYTSSHIDEALSEKVVPNENHSSVVQSQVAIDELRRLLYKHIGRDEGR